MRYALIYEDTRLLAALGEPGEEAWEHPDGYILVDAGDFEPDPERDYCDYIWDGKHLVLDERGIERRESERILDPKEVLAALFKAEPANLDVFPDEALARMAPYMQEWKSDEDYAVGDKRQYGELPYRCLQAHRSQESWNPEDAPSLWARILIPDPAVIPEWVQPGSTNPYMQGDKVKHNGKVWVSDIDNNIWEPSVYGWTEVHDEL